MNLFIFGLGYSARAIARRMAERGVWVAGTVRTRSRAALLTGAGITARLLNDDEADAAIEADIASADALLVSAPPDEAGDPILPRFAATIATAPRARWIGYLSTIGVYGDHAGGWVSEQDAPRPANARTRARVAVEQAWLELGARTGKPAVIFRLAGIYGPGRNALVNLADGSARRVVKPGQVFNRIHVEDIAGAVEASLDRQTGSAIYNIADDLPAPPQDVVDYAAELLKIAPPPAIDFASAALGPMARDFYARNKRVSNSRAKEELGWRLRYPTYREGLQALFEAGDGSAIRAGG